MAIALVMDFPGATRAQYNDVVARMELGGRMPPGGMFHAAGEFEGGWRVIDVWEDMETFGRFRDEQIGPHTAAVGMPEPTVTVVEVSERKAGSGNDAELVQMIRLPGLDAEAFRATDAKVLESGRTPDALTFHVNGPLDDGWCVIDAWTSREARDEFLRDRVIPATQDAPLTGPPQIDDLVIEGSLRAGEPAHA